MEEHERRQKKRMGGLPRVWLLALLFLFCLVVARFVAEGQLDSVHFEARKISLFDSVKQKLSFPAIKVTVKASRDGNMKKNSKAEDDVSQGTRLLQPQSWGELQRVFLDDLETKKDESEEYSSDQNEQEMEEEVVVTGHAPSFDYDPFDSELKSFKGWSDLPEKYQVKDTDTGKFFLYQPSGGWGNQKLILRWAIVAANAMNRTLVLPPVAPHSSFYFNFNQFTAAEVLPMHMILDIAELEKAVFAGIKVHVGDMESYSNKILQHLEWKRYERNPRLFFLSEERIQSRWLNEKAGVVFWHKTGMWKCCYSFDLTYTRFIEHSILYSKYLEAFAYRAIHVHGTRFNAIHFRRGDSYYAERRSIKAYVKYHRRMQRFNRSIPLYIATDESDRSVFEPLKKKHGFSKILFAEDLDRTEMQELLTHIPSKIVSTVSGLVDQLICSFAERWSGSSKSTFTYSISSLRNTRRKRGPFYKHNVSNYRFFPRHPPFHTTLLKPT